MATPMNKKQLAESNDQLVYNFLKNAETKLTISQIAAGIPDITDRTVRKRIESLVQKGFVREYGRGGQQNNAMLFGLVEQDIYDTQDAFTEVELIPFNDMLYTVTEFLEVIVSPDSDPLKANTNINIIRSNIANQIRRIMAGVVLTSGISGQQQFLDTGRENLLKVQIELEYVLRVIKRFNDSAVWYDNYRDRIAPQVRIMQKNKPELYQLAMDFVRSE